MKFLFLLLSFTLSFKAIAEVPNTAAKPSSSTPNQETGGTSERWKKHEKMFQKDGGKTTNVKPTEYYLSNNNACNQTEIQLIENLKARKEALNIWIQNAEQRELTLLNLEQKLQEKIQLLKTLEEKIEKLLNLYSNKKTSEINNLVKVYENMKPKEAAKIFEELELTDLMIIVHNMKTNKISSILANMNPAKAKIITQEIITTDNDIKKFTN